VNSFAVKAIAIVGLFALFIFIFTAFDETSDEREATYQEAAETTEERLREAQTLGERETGISTPGDSDEDGFADDDGIDDDFENEPTDDWGGSE